MNQTKQLNAPQLQPPGAGLPWWESFAARYIVFPLTCRKHTWESSAALFQDEGAKILAVWDSLPVQQINQQVLIKRFAGIEDSSRYWSAVMTVEHLVIVGTGMRQIIATLRKGEVPQRVVRTEDVKPRGEIDPAIIRNQFVQLLADVAEEEKRLPPIARGVGPRFVHPWFGPIDAFQWHCLLGMHQGLHRKQIELIRDGLAST